MSVQERLCAYATKRLFRVLTPAEFSAPWTYLHRRQVDELGVAKFECTGVRVDRADGTTLTISVDEMQSDAAAAERWGEPA